MFYQSSDEQLRAFADVDSFLTESILAMARSASFDRPAAERQIVDIFGIVSALGPDAFRKYDARRGKTVGAFSVSAYEAMTLGISQNLSLWMEVDPGLRAEQLASCAQRLWADTEFLRYSGAGIRATTRAPKMGPVGRRVVIPA